MASYQFDPSLISSEIVSTLSSDYKARPLEASDYDKGFLDALGQLTTVGNISKEKFLERFNLLKSRVGDYLVIVLEETATGKIIGSGTIFIEKKFIHEAGSVGHIEDIVTHDSVRGKGLGKIIIQLLVDLGKKMGAYKVILSAAEKNVGFYEKCGLERKSVTMAVYLDH